MKKSTVRTIFSIDIEKQALILLSATPEMDFTEYDKNHHRNAYRGGRWKKNQDSVMEILASRIGHRQATQHRRVG